MPTTLIVGKTGTGKSELIGTYAKWIYRKYKKKTRLVASDPGGLVTAVKALVDNGIVEVYRPQSRDFNGSKQLIFGTIAKLSRGFWPVGGVDKNGNAAVGVELVEQNYAESNVGAVCFDGLTSLCQWAGQEINFRSGMNTLGGLKGALNTITSDGLVFGSGGMSGVGFIQDKAYEWLVNMNGIAGLVGHVVITALETQADDLNSNRIVGPQIAGNAKTHAVPSWVENCLGCVSILQGKGLEYRLYLRNFKGEDENATHICNVRAMGLPEFLSDGDGEPFSKYNLGVFFDLLEAAKVAEIEKANQEFGKIEFAGDAPGVASAPAASSGVAVVAPGQPAGPRAAASAGPRVVVGGARPVGAPAQPRAVLGSVVVKPQGIPVVVPTVSTPAALKQGESPLYSASQSVRIDDAARGMDASIESLSDEQLIDKILDGKPDKNAALNSIAAAAATTKVETPAEPQQAGNGGNGGNGGAATPKSNSKPRIVTPIIRPALKPIGTVTSQLAATRLSDNKPPDVEMD